MMILPKSWQNYLRQHWFKLMCVVLALFILLQKDLSVVFQLHAPVPNKPIQEKTGPDNKAGENRKPVELLSEAGNPPESPHQLDLSSWLKAPKAMPEFEALGQLPHERIRAFVGRFKEVALAEETKYGIPAELILANALLLSKAGQSAITEDANNYFLLPCTPDWKGREGRYDGTCLREYESAWMSFRDHSLYLTTGARSQLPGKLRGKSPESWADALGSEGFNHIHNYAEQLRATLKKYFNA